ncbi:hypothetical protein I6N95_04940 [Vagococcus sp. BWB3-3]|uniref:DUF3892 domain-containing protein n=1 Tax=Vagococcus allomyrinae TaxID=2794353 RepID=A0A940P3I2_9ENTE|nr:hypothetical protein [Vagococcus allomyrinae]MBP1040355.1 hypothetical protein [Vagococcus allomyrinae]
MIQHVTHIRIRNTEKQGTESIIEVLLALGETRPIKTMIEYLGIGGQYYYFNSTSDVTYIESVHPLYKDSYIRSCNYDGVYDNLMSLPHF